MFGSNDTKEGRKSATSATSSGGSQSNNSLVSGTRIEGTIHTDSDIRIDGVVTGTLFCKGKVIVGASGEIQGDIECSNAVIEGKLNGNLIVKELLQVKESATIEGDVSTAKLIVHAGATFNVTCKMGAQRVKELKREDKTPVELGQLAKVARQ